ncbi:MAG: response regulator transcription factor, partial [bacterium]|nr:response regulator transcription factor [bacterium]
GRVLTLFDKNKITKREREIIRLVVKGKTNKDIENELYISIKTVKCHLYNIYKKLGVRNRIQLANLIHGGFAVTF